MNEEEAKKIIDNMNEQELNDFIFFALQEVEKENQKLKAEMEKKDKIIDLMAYDIATNDSDLCQYIDETIRCKKYAGENKLTCDECIKQYYERKVEDGN